MSIPYKFNPMGGATFNNEPDEPDVHVYDKEFVQPVLLSDSTFDRTKPYSFGMQITNNGGNNTVWQAFDGKDNTAWDIPQTQPIVSAQIDFERTL